MKSTETYRQSHLGCTSSGVPTLHRYTVVHTSEASNEKALAQQAIVQSWRDPVSGGVSFRFNEFGLWFFVISGLLTNFIGLIWFAKWAYKEIQE